MSRKKSLTREYVGTLKDVYDEKGFLAAVGYDIKSTLKHITNGLANIFEPYHSGPDSLSGRWPEDSTGRELQRQAYRNIERREQNTREYLLRGRKNNSLEKSASAMMMFVGIPLGIFLLTPAMTGNVIGNATTVQNAWGAVLCGVGILGVYLFFRS